VEGPIPLLEGAAITRAIDRRHFLEQSMRVAAGVGLASLAGLEALEAAGKPWFKISLAEWSFHKSSPVCCTSDLG